MSGAASACSLLLGVSRAAGQAHWQAAGDGDALSECEFGSCSASMKSHLKMLWTGIS